MKFSLWLEKRNKKNLKNAIKMPDKEPKQRIAGGRKETFFDSRPKRLRTRQAQKRQSQEGW